MVKIILIGQSSKKFSFSKNLDFSHWFIQKKYRILKQIINHGRTFKIIRRKSV